MKNKPLYHTSPDANLISDQDMHWDFQKIDSLPHIIKTVRLLMKEAKKAEEIHCDFTDYYGLYLLKFTARFLQHSHSIIRLGKSKDCWLIARSALEGLVILNWISEKVELRNDRAKRYALLSWKEEYSHLHNMEILGIDPRELMTYSLAKEGLLKNIDSLGLTEQEKKNLIDSISDDKKLKFIPFIQQLMDKTIKQSFEAYLPLTKPDIPEYFYILFYDTFSEYHHWNVRTLFSVEVQGRVRFIHGGEGSLAFALEPAFLSLHRSLSLLNDYYDLNLNNRLDGTFLSYEKWLKTVPIPNR